MLSKCIETAIREGFEVLWLGVWEHNEKALNFYKKMGFVIFDEHIFKLGDDEQRDYLMRENYCKMLRRERNLQRSETTKFDSSNIVNNKNLPHHIAKTVTPPFTF